MASFLNTGISQKRKHPFPSILYHFLFSQGLSFGGTPIKIHLIVMKYKLIN